MSGHRQAAVALHALAATDRSLVMAELPAADRATLQDYLAELDELGFVAAGSAAVASALPRPGGRDVEPDPLRDASSPDLDRLLAGESAVLVAQLLSLQPWAWRGAYLALQTPARREQLRAVAPDGAVAPARAAFLEGAVRARLAAADAGPGAAVAPHAPGSLRADGRRGAGWLRLVRIAWTR